MAGVKYSDRGVISRLATQNIHLRSAIDQVEEGVIILELYPLHGLGPCIVFANRGIGELSGFSTEELLGCSLSKIFGPEKLQALLERLNAVAEVAEKENCHAIIIVHLVKHIKLQITPLGLSFHSLEHRGPATSRTRSLQCWDEHAAPSLDRATWSRIAPPR